MNSLIVDIPENPDSVGTWLAPILVGPELRQLVSELAAFGSPSRRESLSSILRDHFEQVLQNGLEELPADDVYRLLNSPEALIELSEQIFEHGGPYWKKLMDEQELRTTIDRTRTAIQNHLDQSPVTQRATPEAASSIVKQPGQLRRQLLALAAGVLMICGIGYTIIALNSSGPEAVAWGWLDDDAAPPDLSAREYLNKLARGAEEWFNQRPSDVRTVRKRTREFMSGCERLIAAEHANLEAADRDWLKQRLEDCLADIKTQLMRLEQQDAEAIRIRSAVDKIIRDVAFDLRQHAADV